MKVPPPADEDFASLDARVRLKLSLGERLTAEERLFLARLPGGREAEPNELREGQ